MKDNLKNPPSNALTLRQLKAVYNGYKKDKAYYSKMKSSLVAVSSYLNTLSPNDLRASIEVEPTSKGRYNNGVLIEQFIRRILTGVYGNKALATLCDIQGVSNETALKYGLPLNQNGFEVKFCSVACKGAKTYLHSRYVIKVVSSTFGKLGVYLVDTQKEDLDLSHNQQGKRLDALEKALGF